MQSNPGEVIRMVLCAALRQHEVVGRLHTHFGSTTAFLEWTDTTVGATTMQDLANALLSGQETVTPFGGCTPAELNETSQELLLLGEAFSRIMTLEALMPDSRASAE